MLDLALDAKKHDLIFADNDVIFIDNAERVAQQIKIQLLTFMGEWFLDITHGVPYLEYVLLKNPNFTLIREIFREQILSVEDVSGVVDIDLEFDDAARELTLYYKAETDYGLVARKEKLGYGAN